MNVTLLTVGQTCGNKALQVMKSYGVNAGPSDLAVLLGSEVSNKFTLDNNRATSFWMLAPSLDNGTYLNKCNFDAVDIWGHAYHSYPLEHWGGLRPAFPPEVMRCLIDSGVATLTRTIGNVQVVEFGEYPQNIADSTAFEELEQLFPQAVVPKTVKRHYTFDRQELDSCNTSFRGRAYFEYEHKGKQYIRVEAHTKSHEYSNSYRLSNGRSSYAGKPCWIEVKPIEILYDPTGWGVARQVLVSGIPENSVEMFLGEVFWKEIQPSRNVEVSPPRTSPDHQSDVVCFNGRRIR